MENIENIKEVTNWTKTIKPNLRKPHFEKILTYRREISVEKGEELKFLYINAIFNFF